ncbi:MAG: DNA translocase FtsK 4TM domain-containing protein, partial [candidate division NC10 bacterium]
MSRRNRAAGRWQREVKGILALALAGFGVFALAIFKPSLRLADQASPVGPLGVWLAWAVFWAFGYAGYLVPLGLAFYGVTAFLHRRLAVGWPVLAGFGCLLVAFTGLLARASTAMVHKGGVFGWGVLELLRRSVGEVGALLVLLVAVPIGVLFLTQESYTGLLRTIGRRKAALRAQSPQAELPLVTSPSVVELEAAVEPVPPPPPIVVEPAKPKSGLMEKGLARQETFDFGKGGRPAFQLPPIGLLKAPPASELRQTREELQANADILRKKLQDFGVEGRIVQVNPGPVITSYEFEPAPGIKVSQVVNLADDLALSMKAASVRIVGPIPGRGTVAVEVPNPEIASVYLREILVSQEFVQSKGKMPLALGKDVIGTPYVADLTAMPHLLIAGATGSGKSVGLNSMICSILYKATPAEVRFLMIDPKRLELGIYEGIPHLMAPVVTDAREASARLKWIVGKMDERYRLLAEKHVRNIEGYNRGVEAGARLPYWVVIVDELADLMMASAGEVQNSLVRLAQVARAVGIHLIIATQRPSVDVITGLIKANFPARIAFQVASKVDSRTILDGNGAETLLGRGDMLFVPPGTSRPVRVHGSLVAEEETKAVCDFLRKQGVAAYEEFVPAGVEAAGEAAAVAERDDLYWDAVQLVISQRQASISFLQRRLRLGYPQAARFIDMMEQDRI